MTAREGSGARLRALLDAYRTAAHAEADAHFDDRALDAQRRRILARLEQAGQRARVLPFPGAGSAMRPGAGASRRWISLAAAAGLLIGLLTGQLLHIMPGDNWVSRDVRRPAAPAASVPRLRVMPAVATSGSDAEDALLDAIDMAVTRYGATDLRMFDDLTFALEPY